MQKINIQEYLAQGYDESLTEIVILEGNDKNDNSNNREISLSSLKRFIGRYNEGQQTSSYAIPCYRDLNHQELTFIAEKNGDTGLGDHFEGLPVLVDPIGNGSPIIVVQNKDDQEGMLLESGDALLISSQTNRHAIKGTETYNVAYLDKDTFTKYFKPFISTQPFDPSFESHKQPGFGTEVGEEQTAPYAKQLATISSWPEYSSNQYHQYITTRLKQDFEDSLIKSYKKTLLAGGKYKDFNRLFEEESLSLASGCTDSLGKKSDYYYHQYSTVRNLMNQDGFEKTLRQNFGNEHVDGLVNDWAEHVLENAKSSKHTARLNPSRLADYFMENTSEPENVIFLFEQYAGKSKTLMNALREKFSTPCLEAYNQVSKSSFIGQLPFLGKWLAAKATDDYANAMGFNKQ